MPKPKAARMSGVQLYRPQPVDVSGLRLSLTQEQVCPTLWLLGGHLAPLGAR